MECGGTVECVRLESGGALRAEAVNRGVTDTEVSTAELERGRVQGFTLRIGEPQCLVSGSGRPWVNLTVSRGLHFLVCKMGLKIRTLSTLQGDSD